MQNNKELAVVIPVFNEEKSIVSLIQDWQKVFIEKSISFEFIVINDGSTDQSLPLLKVLQQRFSFITIISHHNQGHGPSLLAGYKLAESYKWVFQIDSDHECETGAFTSLWKNRHQYDFLIGERKDKDASIARRIISLISFVTVCIFYGKKIRDVNSPYRLMKGDILKKIIEKIPAKSFAPNILITGFFVTKKLRTYICSIEKRKEAAFRKSKMNLYFAKGALLSVLQTISFRFKL